MGINSNYLPGVLDIEMAKPSFVSHYFDGSSIINKEEKSNIYDFEGDRNFESGKLKTLQIYHNYFIYRDYDSLLKN